MKSVIQHVMMVLAAFSAYFIGWIAGGTIKFLVSLSYPINGYFNAWAARVATGKPVKFINNQLL